MHALGPAEAPAVGDRVPDAVLWAVAPGSLRRRGARGAPSAAGVDVRVDAVRARGSAAEHDAERGVPEHRGGAGLYVR